MKKINLWEETIKVLTDNNKTWQDVEIVFCDSGRIEKSLYEETAKNTQYYNGFGSVEIDLSLVILGEDFRIIRKEINGEEWFEFISYDVIIPTKEVNKKEFKLKVDD